MKPYRGNIHDPQLHFNSINHMENLHQVFNNFVDKFHENPRNPKSFPTAL